LSQARAPLWRAVRQFLAVLIAAIIPQPSLRTIQRQAALLRYRLSEKTRRRKLQAMPTLNALS
jgi:hypothetical protein